MKFSNSTTASCDNDQGQMKIQNCLNIAHAHIIKSLIWVSGTPFNHSELRFYQTCKFEVIKS